MWEVITTECFDGWFLAQDDELRESIYEAMGVLEKFGPNLGRPYVDTLHGSDFPNTQVIRLELFLHLTLSGGQSFYVLAIKQGSMKNGSTRK